MGFDRPGFVTGVVQEAKLIPGNLPVICSGADAKAARLAARRLIGEGCDILVSFGLAGGLAPTLKPGALLLPEAVIDPDGDVFVCHPAEVENALTGPIAGSDRLLASPALKKSMFDKCRALAVDMESHAVARTAKESGIPFLVLRAVADTADMALPGFIAKATNPDGSTRIGAILSGLAADPGALFDLIRLARSSRRGFEALATALPRLLKTMQSPAR